MKNDSFWKMKTSAYCKAFGFFRKLFIAETGVEDNEVIESHWFNFIHNTCDCEGCREDDDCTAHIVCEEEDPYIE